jgi:hypothetical protein
MHQFGLFEVLWTLAAVYWVVLLGAAVTVFVRLTRGRHDADRRS